jgi:hypothetical protein
MVSKRERGGTTTNSIKSLTARMLVACSKDPKTYHKELYSEPNPMEGELKDDRNPGERGQRLDALCSRQADMERTSSTVLNQLLIHS